MIVKLQVKFDIGKFPDEFVTDFKLAVTCQRPDSEWVSSSESGGRNFKLNLKVKFRVWAALRQLAAVKPELGNLQLSRRAATV